MGVIAVFVYMIAGFALGLFVLSAIDLPPDVAMGGAALVAAFGGYLGQ